MEIGEKREGEGRTTAKNNKKTSGLKRRKKGEQRQIIKGKT